MAAVQDSKLVAKAVAAVDREGAWSNASSLSLTSPAQRAARPTWGAPIATC